MSVCVVIDRRVTYEKVPMPDRHVAGTAVYKDLRFYLLWTHIRLYSNCDYDSDKIIGPVATLDTAGTDKTMLQAR